MPFYSQQQLVSRFRQYLGDDLVALILFGSRARGDARPDSDYDVFPLAGNLPERPLERLLFVRRAIAAKVEEKIAITARTPEEFERGFPSLYLDLGLDGVVLYDTGAYMSRKLQHSQAIIRQAGLERKRPEHELGMEKPA